MIVTTGVTGQIILTLEPHTTYRFFEDIVGYVLEPLEGEDLADAIAEEALDLEPLSPELQASVDAFNAQYRRRTA
jgi:hypothetical protein